VTADERLALIRVKIERAEKHIVDLDGEIRTFLATKPYRVREDVDTKHVYKISHVTEVPGPIVAIAGDVIQNLRSALDHLANQLMLVRLGVVASDQESHFPIGNTAGKYEANLRGMKKGRFLREDAFDVLLKVQAYPRGDGHQLWALNRLNNIDKHRIILTAGSAFRSVNLGAYVSRKSREVMAPDFPMLDAFFRPADNMCPLKIGDVLFTSDGHMDPDNDFRFDVAFNEPKIVEGKPILETLQHFADLVRSTVNSCKPCLT